MGDIVAGNPALAAILASTGTESSDLAFAFIVTVLQIVAIVAAVAGVQIALRMYSEETDHRVEPLLATTLRRPTYFASNVVMALSAPALGLVLAGLALGVVADAKDDGIAMTDVVLQSVATIAATWALVALALAVVGAMPRIRRLAWLAVVATFGLTILGPTFKLPEWALSISPLHHTPNVTEPGTHWSSVMWLGAITLVLVVVGFTGFRRRDIL
ncbi:hypothetical protein [Rhodococcus chondri]|uniref:ABC transporter permease n=1 Tax=Rhodococcus chondri TaxID=3065941 RepID=A0ABU7JT12_9NOCA|nr:hypothetical protein [Rhodococcus sp. CC-R104]MEE2032624.1 hypothetical protein [Rhodococcus sp. CC-R104]